MCKHIRKLIALALADIMLLSLTGVAFAAEVETAVEGGASAASSVWSDAEPNLALETQDVSVSLASTASYEISLQVDPVYPSYANAYNTMIGLQSTYPEGTTWTNYEPYGSKGSSPYFFKGGAIKGARYGVGCAAFCFILSDTVFGDLPARVLDAGSFTYDKIHVGDFLRVNSNHFVMVLRITSSGVIVAEGNYNSSVHWGRAISKDELMFSANFLVTRYPANYTDPSEGNVDEVVAQGTEGSLKWTITRGGLLSITGTGAMDNYSEKRPSWESAEDNSGAAVSFDMVDIGSGITSVGAYAFGAAAPSTATVVSNIMSVDLPDTITSIDNGAFRYSGIVGISIPSGVKTVADDAFRNCSNLTSVSISDGVQTIGERAFHSCTSLGYIDIPGSVTSIGAGSFTGCYENLRQVRFMPSQNGITIGDQLFVQCYNLNFISLPEGITTLPAGLFQSCKTIQYLYLPKSLESIMAVADQTDPFMSASGVSIIYFGGTEAQWNALVNAIPATGQSSKTVLAAAEVYFEQSDPFVAAADDPGDIHFCENGLHYGPIVDGVCQNCGNPASSPSSEPSLEPPSEPTEVPSVSPTATPSAAPLYTPSSTPAPTPSGDLPFTDVPATPGSWKYENIKFVNERGIMTGVSPTEFQPDEPLTRAQFASVIYRMADSPKVTYQNIFTDVPAGKWYTDAVIWAYENKIVAGLGDGRYGINDNITREQMARMLMEFARVQGYDVSARADFGKFEDASQVSKWALENMQWAVGSGIISGSVKDGKYYMNPKGQATRAECAVMLTKFIRNMQP